jgi:hypothetical protein
MLASEPFNAAGSESRTSDLLPSSPATGLRKMDLDDADRFFWERHMHTVQYDEVYRRLTIMNMHETSRSRRPVKSEDEKHLLSVPTLTAYTDAPTMLHTSSLTPSIAWTTSSVDTVLSRHRCVFSAGKTVPCAENAASATATTREKKPDEIATSSQVFAV